MSIYKNTQTVLVKVFHMNSIAHVVWFCVFALMNLRFDAKHRAESMPMNSLSCANEYNNKILSSIKC